MPTPQKQIDAFKNQFYTHLDGTVDFQNSLVDKLVQILTSDKNENEKRKELNEVQNDARAQAQNLEKSFDDFTQKHKSAVQSLWTNDNDAFFEEIRAGLGEAKKQQDMAHTPREPARDNRLASEYDPSLKSGGPQTKPHPLMEKMDLSVQRPIQDEVDRLTSEANEAIQSTPQQELELRNRLKQKMAPKPKMENRLRHRAAPTPRPPGM